MLVKLGRGLDKVFEYLLGRVAGFFVPWLGRDKGERKEMGKQ